MLWLQVDEDHQHPALFLFNRSAGSYWFNTRLTQSQPVQQAYWFAGWLMGQAVPNRSILGVQIATLVFDKLMSGANLQV